MKISVAEGRIMDLLWKSKPPLAVEEIAAALSAGEEGWTEATVRTLITRLKKKGAVTTSKVGRRMFYRALTTRELFLSQESESFVDRMFDGRIGALVANFTQNRELSREEIDELQALIDRLGHGR